MNCKLLTLFASIFAAVVNVFASTPELPETPDFARPADVAKNANAVLDVALKNDKPVEALRAAIQWAIAKESISSDSTEQIFNTLRELPRRMTTPYSNVAYLLEATFLQQMYSNNRWNYDQRQLPPGEYALNPKEWSGLQFREKIEALCDSALADPTRLSSEPLSTIEPLVKYRGRNGIFGLSLYDFIVYRVMELNGSIGDEKRNADLLATLIEYDRRRARENATVRDGALFLALMTQMQFASEDESMRLADSFLKTYHDTPVYYLALAAVYFHCNAAMSEPYAQNFYKEVVAEADRLKALKGAKSEQYRYLSNVASRMAVEAVGLTCDAQVLPGSPFKVNWKSQSCDDFHILVVKLPAGYGKINSRGDGRLTLPVIKAKGKVVAHRKISAPGEIPFEKYGEVAFDGLSAGSYVIVSATGETLSTVKGNKYDFVIVNVSRLAYIKDADGGKGGIYIVDGSNGAPVVDAYVKFIRQYSSTSDTHTGRTNRQGYIPLPSEGTWQVEAVDGADQLSFLIYGGGRGYSADHESVDAAILTDLAIYRPGDKVQTVTVLSRCIDNIVTPASGEPFSLRLYDANHQQVDSLTLHASTDGRAVADFTLPTTGMTGTYRLEARQTDERMAGATSFEVAEYKAPTFKVNLERPDISDQNKTDKITLNGNVATYSGVPLAGCDVKVEIAFHPWWRFGRRPVPTTFSLSGTTDAEGNFSVEIDQSLLQGEAIGMGSFSAVASATSPAGETCDSERISFSLGERYSLQSSLGESLEIKTDLSASNLSDPNPSDTVEIPVKVLNAVGNPVEHKVRYEIEETYGGDVRISGEFTSPILRLKKSQLPSGEYRMRFIIDQPVASGPDTSLPTDIERVGAERADTLTVNTIVWRADDQVAPSRAAVWSPVSVVYAEPGASKVKIRVGNSYKAGYVYMKVDRSNTTDKRAGAPDVKVMKIDAQMETVEVDAPAPGERLRITVFGIHDLIPAETTVEVRPAADNVRMEILADTFRDHILPGSRESWKFRLTANGEVVEYPAIMAVMTNQALNAITPFSWRFDPLSARNYIYGSGLGYGSVYTERMMTRWTGEFPSVDLKFPMSPDWNFYGRPLYSEYGMRQYIKVRGYASSKSAATGSVNMSEVVDEMAYDSAPVMNAMADMEAVKEESVDATDAGSGDTTNGEALRQIECPLAFFMPMLSGNQNGEVSVDFTVPDFNTTWQLQIIGYDPADMRSASAVLTTVAAKQVMVQTNAPRFLRTGDKTRIEATLFNNSDMLLPVGGSIEIFNPEDGKIYAQQKFEPEELRPSASKVIAIEFRVPQYITMVGIRSRATSDKSSDGEQTAIAVLPASQPMYDATTWYIGSNETSAEVSLPKMEKGSRVTLEYCDNPEWAVLMSLSGILNPQGESALALADAIYSNATGRHILQRNPALCKSLKRVVANGDSAAMTSPLQKNESLKMASLGDTPWVNNGAAETARMQSVVQLADTLAVESAISSLRDRLAALQGGDGGWSWCNGMPSSFFMTEEVLWRMAAMKSAGSLPTAMEAMIRGGVKYCDAQLEKEWREAKARGSRYSVSFSDLQYFFVRGRFDMSESKIIRDIKSKVVDMIRKNWKEYDVTMKCLGAMLLAREGHRSDALPIMESVRQFGSYTPQKGMWFDGATGPLSRTAPVESAAIGLMAFREILPDDVAVERIRQYLLLSRQTQDWQLGMSDAKAVVVAQAILTGDSAHPVTTDNSLSISIDGKPLDLSGYAGMPGSFVMDLNAEAVSGRTLEVHRQGGVPAWGGVLAQYEAPMKEVKARSMEQLKVEKAFYPVESDSLRSSVGKATDTFRKGDRVRVTLTVTTNRDLDYLMVRDERGACMEPREQLTRYVSEDGIIYVREQRDACTNLYIYRMPKGVHVISYEVTADRDGEYASGSATAQCLYYPLITARSSASEITVKTK